MLVLIACSLAGVGLGVVTGLIPGLHVNNLTPALVLLAGGSGSLELAALIVAMSITNVFISYIPSTFLGVPDEGTELSVLPAHRLLLEGRGFRSIVLTTWGCLGGLMSGAAMLIPFLFLVGPVYLLLNQEMHFVLSGVVLVMIALERSPVRIGWAGVIFGLSGLLGLLTLDSGFIKGDAALMPLLSGLFGASVLLPSILEGSTLPEQYLEEEELSITHTVKPLAAGTTAGAVTGIVPGIGPSQGTVLAQLAIGSGGTEEFLTAVSSVNTSKTLFSFVALYAIGRARSGAAVAVGHLIKVGPRELVFLVGIALLAGGMAAVLALRLGKIVATKMERVPYRKLCAGVLGVVTVLVFLYSGFFGLLVFGTSTAIGILPSVVKVKRTHCMGVIILPCILYFAGLKESALGLMGL